VIDWQATKAALRAFVVATGVVPETDVVWEREAHGLTYGNTIELRIGSERALGTDDVAQVETSPGVWALRITGTRECTLSIRYSSRSQATAARDALEIIREHLFHPVLLQSLSDAGVAVLSAESVRTFDSLSDARWESIAVLDVHLGLVSSLLSTVPIEHLAAVDMVTVPVVVLDA
jgi:hypothetical protein